MAKKKSKLKPVENVVLSTFNKLKRPGVKIKKIDSYTYCPERQRASVRIVVQRPNDSGNATDFDKLRKIKNMSTMPGTEWFEGFFIETEEDKNIDGIEVFVYYGDMMGKESRRAKACN